MGSFLYLGCVVVILLFMYLVWWWCFCILLFLFVGWDFWLGYGFWGCRVGRILVYCLGCLLLFLVDCLIVLMLLVVCWFLLKFVLLCGCCGYFVCRFWLFWLVLWRLVLVVLFWIDWLIGCVWCNLLLFVVLFFSVGMLLYCCFVWICCCICFGYNLVLMLVLLFVFVFLVLCNLLVFWVVYWLVWYYRFDVDNCWIVVWFYFLCLVEVYVCMGLV